VDSPIVLRAGEGDWVGTNVEHHDVFDPD